MKSFTTRYKLALCAVRNGWHHIFIWNCVNKINWKILTLLFLNCQFIFLACWSDECGRGLLKSSTWLYFGPVYTEHAMTLILLSLKTMELQPILEWLHCFQSEQYLSLALVQYCRWRSVKTGPYLWCVWSTGCDLYDATKLFLKALLRPGRLDRIVYVPLPDAQTRRHIFSIHMKKSPTADIDLEDLVVKTKGYSGAEVI